MVRRSVLRRRRPKFESHQLVRSSGQRSPVGLVFFGSFEPGLRILAMNASSISRATRQSRVASESSPRFCQLVSMSPSRPHVAASSRVGARRIESLRFAPSMVHPIGMPPRSLRMLHLHQSFERSVGFFPVPSPPQGLLCKLASTATSESSSPITRSNAPIASVVGAS